MYAMLSCHSHIHPRAVVLDAHTTLHQHGRKDTREVDSGMRIEFSIKKQFNSKSLHEKSMHVESTHIEA